MIKLNSINLEVFLYSLNISPRMIDQLDKYVNPDQITGDYKEIYRLIHNGFFRQEQSGKKLINFLKTYVSENDPRWPKIVDFFDSDDTYVLYHSIKEQDNNYSGQIMGLYRGKSGPKQLLGWEIQIQDPYELYIRSFNAICKCISTESGGHKLHYMETNANHNVLVPRASIEKQRQLIFKIMTK